MKVADRDARICFHFVYRLSSILVQQFIRLINPQSITEMKRLHEHNEQCEHMSTSNIQATHKQHPTSNVQKLAA
jgi:hypothetical protein